MNAEVIKNVRTEEREDRSGRRIRTRTVTTWDLIKDGCLISEHRTKKDVVEAGKAFNRNVMLSRGRRPIVAVRYPRQPSR